MEHYLACGTLLLAIAGAAWDLATRRIPNALTYSGMISGVLLRAWLAGGRGIEEALLGGLIGGGVFLVFFLVRGMGAGDVKLMTAICCWAGLHQAVAILVATALAGGVLAIAYMIWHGRVGTTLRNLGALARFHLAAGLQVHPQINLSNAQELHMPYGVAIAFGTLVTLGPGMLSGR
jgi:prepilin peptidase CpaA